MPQPNNKQQDGFKAEGLHQFRMSHFGYESSKVNDLKDLAVALMQDLQRLARFVGDQHRSQHDIICGHCRAPRKVSFETCLTCGGDAYIVHDTCARPQPTPKPAAGDVELRKLVVNRLSLLQADGKEHITQADEAQLEMYADEIMAAAAQARKGYEGESKPAPADYDSLETNPIISNTPAARAIEGILRGFEPVADGHGKPKGFDLNKDGRTEYGYYWEFEDMADAAQEIAAWHESELAAKVAEARQQGVVYAFNAVELLRWSSRR